VRAYINYVLFVITQIALLRKILAERARALKAKERFARTASGFGSDGSIDGPSRDRDTPVWPESDRPPAAGAAGAAGGGGTAAGGDIEFVRPQTVGEEELQLQLAIAMSKEEAEQEDQKRRSDDVRLQLALSQSEQDFKKSSDHPVKKESNNLVDLLDISFGASGISSPQSSDPWGLPPSIPPQPRSTAVSSCIECRKGIKCFSIIIVNYYRTTTFGRRQLHPGQLTHGYRHPLHHPTMLHQLLFYQKPAFQWQHLGPSHRPAIRALLLIGFKIKMCHQFYPSNNQTMVI